MANQPLYKLPEGEDFEKKPLVFGTSAYDPARLDEMEYATRHWDASYVPGYSEARAENEQRVKNGKAPVPMPRLHWLRVTRPDGATYVSDTDEAMVNWVQLGYRAMGLSDLRRYGYGWPPAAGSGPAADGLIRRGGDLALFYVDEEQADRNRLKRAIELGEEAEFVPDTKTGEVYPLDDERQDFRGPDNIRDALRADLPKLT